MALAGGLAATAGQAQSATLGAAADSYLKKGSANQNQGQEAILRIQSSGPNRALARFDQGEIATAVGNGSLVSATLELTIRANGNNWGSTGRSVGVHRLTAGWTEAGVTWNCAADTDPANGSPDCSAQWAGGTFLATATSSVLHTNGLAGVVRYDVTADVAAFLAGTPNHGWLLKLADEGASGMVDYASREEAGGDRPRLVLVVEGPVVDQTPPQLAFTAPRFFAVVNDPTPAIVLEYSDGGSGVDPTSLRLTIDGVDRTAGCSPEPASAACEPPALAPGRHVLEARLADRTGNVATAASSFDLLLGPGPHTVTFASVADTYLKEGSPNQNQGHETLLRIRESGSNRALVRFRQEEIAGILGGARVLSATLEPYLESNGNNWGPDGRTVDAHHLTADWTELGATWNCPSDADVTDQQPDCPAPWDGGAFAAAPSGTVLHTNGLTGRVRFDVTADVAAFLAGTSNHGWLLKKTNEGQTGLADYASREGTAGREPYLVVVFDIPVGGADTTAPTLAIVAPIGTVYNDETPEIRVEYSDTESGIDTASLAVRVDGVELAGCQVGASGATCRPAPLATGSRSIRAEIRDRAGTLAIAVRNFDLILDTTGPTLELFAPNGSTGSEGDAPEVGVVFADPGSGIEPGSFRLTLDGVELAGCTVSDLSARCLLPSLDPGSRAIAAEVRDRAGNVARSTLVFEIAADVRRPTLVIAAPATGRIHGVTLPEIVLEYEDDQSGVASATLTVSIDGSDVTASCQTNPSGAVCPARALPVGIHRIDATVADQRGNRATVHREVELSTHLEIAIESPVNGAVTRDATATITGTVAPEAEGVRIGNVEAAVSGGRFVASNVPLREGSNALTATARSGASGVGTATVTVVRDTDPPRVIVNSPRDGFVAATSEIVVAGEVADLTSSSQDLPPLSVTVNGLPAAVELRTFLLSGYLLHPGENVIRVEAEDAAGNVGHAEVRVTFSASSLGRLELLSGHLQTAQVGEPLAEPLAVRVADFLDRPLAGRTVEFAVTRGDGTVNSGLDRARRLSVLTDNQGIAQVSYTLGNRAGEGNHEVVATSLGIPGAVIFCASARPGPPAMLLPIIGNEFQGARFGAVGRPYPKPLFTQLFDEFGNPVPGVEVIFRMVSGGGAFDGAPEMVATTDREGRARVIFTLGPEEGINNNVVTASFAGYREIPATFVISGLAPGPPEATAIAGVLLDPADAPVPNAGIRIGSLSTQTDAEGRFRLAGVPVGTLHLEIDGSTVSRPGVWPHLGYELVAIAGRENTLGKPLRLPPIDDAGKKWVGGDEDVVVPIRGVAGATLTVFANSATFPDGSRQGWVSFTQVPSYKVPMVAPMNTNFQLAWSVQPPGVRFDPPAKVTIPNFGAPESGGNAPGMTTEIFSFDHDLEEFVSAGTAAISEDGQRMESLPGFGIVKSGWGGCPRPPSPPAGACEPGTCTKCDPGPAPRFDPPDITVLANGEETSVVVPVGEPVRFTVTAAKSGLAESCDTSPEWSFGDGMTQGGGGVSHAYQEPGEYDAKATVHCEGCPSPNNTDQVKVVVVDLSIKQAEYRGEGFHAVLQDSNDGPYNPPHWQDNSSELDGDAVDSGDRRFPVSYRRGSTIEMSLKIQAGATLPADIAGKTKVRGRGTQGVEFPATAASPQGEQIVADGLRASSALPNTVDLLDRFEVSWEISFDDGQTWAEVGKTENRVYVTLNDPIDDAPLFETLLDVGCRNAKGASSPGGAFAQIWTDFTDRGVRRKATDGFNKPDGQVMRYWFPRGAPENDQVNQQCRLLSQMLSPRGEPFNGVGNCGAWANLLHRTAQALGIPGSETISIDPDQGANVGAQGFLVKNWTFARHIRKGRTDCAGTPPPPGCVCESTAKGDDIPAPSGSPICVLPGPNGALDSPSVGNDRIDDGAFRELTQGTYPYALFDELDRPALGSRYGDVIDRPGVEGQTNPNPPGYFLNHFVVRFGGQIYDPSYGRLFPNEGAHENGSIEGILAVNPGADRFGFAKPQDPVRPELTYESQNIIIGNSEQE